MTVTLQYRPIVAVQFAGAGIDEPYWILEAGGQQVLGHDIADAVRLAARADQCDVRGLEEAVEVADRHWC